MPKFQASAPAFAGFRQLPGGGFSFTMVPNQFLDEIVPIEKPCVVKVVCLVLRRTLGWIDQTGQRRQQNQVAYSEFAREMNMSTQAVADGLRIALEKGYIVRVRAGTMRDATSGNPEAASYGLRWMSPLQPAPVNASSNVLSNASSYKSESHTPDSEIATAPDALASAPLATTTVQKNSKNQIVSSSLKSRDMINKADSEKSKKLELKISSKNSEPQKNGKFSRYIGNLISDIGVQFGDDEHRLSNIKQALNGWEASRLAEKEYVQLLYQARELTRQHTSTLKAPVATEKPDLTPKFNSWITLAGSATLSETFEANKSGQKGPRNRMPYFFKVVQDLLRRPSLDLPPSQAVEAPAASKISGSPQVQAALHNTRKRFLNSTKRESKETVEKSLFGEAQPISNPIKKEIELPQESGPVEIPSELVRLAENFAAKGSAPLATWQRWQAGLQDTRLKSLGRRLIFLEKSQVRPELLSYIFPRSVSTSEDTSKQILLVFRNSFDARYATSFLDEIGDSLKTPLQTNVQLFVTYG